MRVEFDNFINKVLRSVKKVDFLSPKDLNKSKKNLEKIGNFLDEVKAWSREYNDACKESGLPKCPRCYYYNGIPMNYLGMCDTCCRTLLTNLPLGAWEEFSSEEERNELINRIKICHKAQIETLRR